MGCDAPVTEDENEEPAVVEALQCVDRCESDADCSIGGLRARCADGLCTIDDIDGEPPCRNDLDCNLLIASLTGTRELRCERTSDCVAPSYSGPCVVGHSSGVAFCGFGYVGLCAQRLRAKEKNGQEVDLCLATPGACIDGTCRRATETCTGGVCACEDAQDCKPMYGGPADCVAVAQP